MKKKSALVLLLTGIFLLPACKFKTMYDEKDNLEILRKNMDAGRIKMIMVKEINHTTGDTTNFIELTFTNSPQFNDGEIDRSYLASRCAIKAFQLFNPATWEGKDGVSIVLKNDGEETGTKRFYSLDELREVRQIINHFNRFINVLEKARTYALDNNTKRLLPADSVEIASCFEKILFAQNPDLVHLFLDAYIAYNANLDSADRKYFFKWMSISDTVGLKITRPEMYQFKSTFIEPLSNDLFKIDFIVTRDHPDKFISLNMFEKEGHEGIR